MQKLLNIYGIAISTIFLAPIAYLVYRAGVAYDPSGPVSDQILEPTIRTLVLATLVSTSAACLGTALAWVTQRTNVAAKKILVIGAVLPLAIPTYVGALALIGAWSGEGGIIHELAQLAGFNLVRQPRGLLPAWITLTLFTYPYVFLLVRAKLKRMHPAAEESATMLGKTRFQVFRFVTLPQLRPAILSGSLVVFLYCLSEYGAVQLLSYDTLTRVIYTNFLTNTFVATTCSLIVAALATIAVVLERKLGVTANIHQSEVLVDQIPVERLNKAPKWVWPLVLTVGFSVLVVPITTFSYWFFRNPTNSGVELGETITVSVQTLLTGLIAGLITMLVVLPAAQLTLHSKHFGARLTRVTVLIGYAIPGVVIALAVVFFNLRVPGFGWLYQTYPMLMLAYILHFGSLGLGAGETALSSVPKNLKESARLLHPSQVNRWRRVHLPLIRPGVLTGVGLVMLAVVKELPATLKLAPTGFSTLATDLFSAAGEGFDAKVGVLSLILILVSAFLTWLLIIRNET